MNTATFHALAWRTNLEFSNHKHGYTLAAMSSTPRAEGLPPAWASTLGGDGFREFIAVVQRYFGRRDITIEIDPEQGVVRPSIKLFSVSSAFGLQNLLQSCAQNPLHKWQGIIETHFDSILNAPGADNALTVDVTDFARIAPQLRARKY